MQGELDKSVSLTEILSEKVFIKAAIKTSGKARRTYSKCYDFDLSALKSLCTSIMKLTQFWGTHDYFNVPTLTIRFLLLKKAETIFSCWGT